MKGDRENLGTSAAASSHGLRVAADHHRAGRLREAEHLYRELLHGASPETPPPREPVILLGMLLRDHGRTAEAAQVYRDALGRRPDDAEFWDELAVTLFRLRDSPEAERAARRAFTLNPADPLICTHLANVLSETDRPEEALPFYQAAIDAARGKPEAIDAWYNLGVTLYDLGRAGDAIAALEEAVKLDLNFAEAQAKLGMALLARGDWTCGWPKYEWRRGRHAPGAENPRRLDVEHIVLESDQGLGDAIQMVRYAPLVRARMIGDARMTVRCQGELHRLFAGVGGVDAVTSSATPPVRNAGTTHLSMMSLPHVFGTTLDSIPASVPYMHPDENASARWSAVLRGDRNRRVGIAWAGNPAHRDDRRRSCPPEQLAPLGAVAGVTFYSLQKHGGAGGGGVLPFPLIDHTAALHDLADAAALIANLDLVLSVDTAVAHLAAAMGKPTWILLARVPDWRWMLDRDDSPWYPTVRLFRQAQRGDWNEPVRRAAKELKQFAAAHLPAAAAPPAQSRSAP